MFLILFWSVVCGAIALMALAFVRLRREHQNTIFDFLLILVPLALWWVLAVIGWKTKSLANLIEPLAIGVLIPVILSFRTFATGYGTNRQRSIGAFFICIFFAVVLYAVVPALPE
jgi:glycerol uptake facilitator-like aquaporin